MSLLDLKNLNVRYGGITAVRDVSLRVDEGEVVSLIGSNGAGKTSILKAISGLIPSDGQILFDGMTELRRMQPDGIVKSGVVHVPEGRGIFGNLTIRENLILAAWQRRDDIGSDLDSVYRIFPRLKERVNQEAGTLSGGEQQMLAVGRALIMNARLLLLDEPSMGLSPRYVKEIFRVLHDIKKRGTTILLVEQNARMALNLATRGYVMETGSIILSGTSGELINNPSVVAAYLG
jgi:branched-chain amino acid transport system ATP-binding protein